MDEFQPEPKPVIGGNPMPPLQPHKSEAKRSDGKSGRKSAGVYTRMDGIFCLQRKKKKKKGAKWHKKASRNTQNMSSLIAWKPPAAAARIRPGTHPAVGSSSRAPSDSFSTATSNFRTASSVEVSSAVAGFSLRMSLKCLSHGQALAANSVLFSRNPLKSGCTSLLGSLLGCFHVCFFSHAEDSTHDMIPLTLELFLRKRRQPGTVPEHCGLKAMSL